MTNTTLDNTIIKKSFQEVLTSLSNKEKDVITRRIGLNGDKETLQKIGNSFSPSITRERVRQIEESGIKKIGRIIKATSLAAIQDYAKEILNLSGGIVSADKLLNEIIKGLELPKDVNSSILEIVIQSDFDIKKSKPRLGVLTHFFFPNISKDKIDLVHKEAVKILNRKKDVIEKEDLYNIILERNADALKGKSIVFVDSVLDIFEDIVKGEDIFIGLTKWKILNPKTLKDKAIYVMKKSGVPMHFVDISNQITEYLGEVVKINTIHNELIRNSEFVLIGRGIYALKEWGFIPGTVIDVIANVLEKKGGPMTTEEIIDSVLKTRKVKNTTIYMNLQNKDIIERVGRNYYQLKQK